jgi:hypothetical protein
VPRALTLTPPRRPTRASRWLRGARLLSAHCATDRAGPEMPVPPRMQGWPVGAPIFHVLLLHA